MCGNIGTDSGLVWRPHLVAVYYQGDEQKGEKSYPPNSLFYITTLGIIAMTPVLGKLKNRPQFLKVAAKGRKWVTPGFILQVRPHNDQERIIAAHQNIRIGYSVSKKVGGAVVRNRVKRRLRALVAKVISSRAKTNRDYVLIGRKNAFDRPFNFMVSDMNWALRKLDARVKILKETVEHVN